MLSINLILAQEINTELPVVSPQSPTTADLGKYGEVQVNESTGMISPSIPLFTYNAGVMQIPISINYSGNGVKVNQDPTWAGVNWNVNPGGVITRVVKDRPDEKTSSFRRIYLSELELDALEGVREVNEPYITLNQTAWYEKMIELTMGAIDSELDIFNYNFMGYSGSFYLDSQYKVKFIKFDKEIKIDFFYEGNGTANENYENNENYFIIVTPNGDTYRFGGSDATELSKTYLNTGAGSTVNVPYNQNAYYLKEIVVLNGGTISFDYTNFGLAFPCSAYKSGIQENASVSFPLGNYPCNKTVKEFYTQDSKMIFLNKISNSINDDVVEFNTIYVGECNRLAQLKTIELKTGLNATNRIKKIDLDYLTVNETSPESKRKFFLNKIELYGTNNSIKQEYGITYITPELFPSKDSFAQDHLGYYNGSNSNTTLLPITDNIMLNSNCHFGLANREASLDHSKIGALQEIQYPTGGKITYEYELPYKGEEDILVNHYTSAFFRNPSTDNSSSYYQYVSNYHTYSSILYPLHGEIGSLTGGPSYLLLNSPKTISFIISISKDGIFDTGHDHVTLEAYRVSDSGYSEMIDSFTKDFDELSDYYNVTSTFDDLPMGNYYFKLSVNLKALSPSSTNYSVIANATLQLPQGTRDTYNPGLRIQKVTVNDDNGNNNVTRYYYNKLGSLNVENYTFKPKYVSKTWRLNTASINVTFDEVFNLNTNTVNNIFNNDMGSYTYENVTISYGGDLFEKGGKELTFKKTENINPTPYNTHPMTFEGQYIYGFYPGGGDAVIGFGKSIPQYDTSVFGISSNQSYDNSTLVKEVFFNQNQKRLKQTVYEYDDQNINNVGNNIKVTSIVNLANASLSKNPTHYTYLLYKTNTYKYRLKSTTTTEYFGNDFTDEMVSTQTYTYDEDKVSLPKTISSENSLEESTKVKVYYPSNVNEIPVSDLNATDLANINLLQSKHNISQPIRIENYVSENLLDTKQFSFGNFYGKILPRAIMTSKGDGPLEERIEYLNYYYNKPRTLSVKNGMRILYEYNDYLQVTSKVENLDTTYAGEYDENQLPEEIILPENMITNYNYDPDTHELISIEDPKEDIIHYQYDPLGRLKQIKNKNSKVLSDFLYHFKNE